MVVGLSIVASLKTFDIVWGMTKGGPGTVSETLALTMYKETFVNSDYGLGSAIAVFLTVITLVASAFIFLRLIRPNLFLYFSDSARKIFSATVIPGIVPLS